MPREDDAFGDHGGVDIVLVECRTVPIPDGASRANSVSVHGFDGINRL
jgi:hypothetical protein